MGSDKLEYPCLPDSARNSLSNLLEGMKQVHLAKEPSLLTLGTPPKVLVTNKGEYKFDQESSCYMRG
jgi:hypothetical protein